MVMVSLHSNRNPKTGFFSISLLARVCHRGRSTKSLITPHSLEQNEMHAHSSACFSSRSLYGPGHTHTTPSASSLGNGATHSSLGLPTSIHNKTVPHRYAHKST